jgi:hypothetical protein
MIGGCNDAHVYPVLGVVAKGREASIFEHPEELWLDLERESAHLVEKQGSTVCGAEVAEPV